MKASLLICCFIFLGSCANVVPLEPRKKESLGLKPIPFKNKTQLKKKGNKTSERSSP